jgi:hypothetical protein
VISNLFNDDKLSIFNLTVLKDNHDNRRTGKLKALEYIFQFLDAYDFSSEGTEEIQEEKKREHLKFVRTDELADRGENQRK